MEEKVDKKRRNFLKILAVGGGALVLGKFLGPKIDEMVYGPTTTKEFDQFNVSQNRKELTISTKDGEEIFIMDNER